MFKKARENNPELINIGKKWSKDEESLLLLRIKEKKSHLEISSEFKRTPGGIVSRLKDVAVKLYNDNESIEIIEKITSIKREIILEKVNRTKPIKENKKNMGKINLEEEKVTKNKEYIIEEPIIPDAIIPKPEPVYELNEEQEAVMEEIEKGHNVFITGPGGTGKSFIIRHIKKVLEAKGKKVGVTSLTGMASLLIGEGAKTIHSWAGVGVGNRSVSNYYEFIRVKHKKARDAWKKTNVLIIDEISMMSDELFEKLDALAKLIRWCPEKPFGGIQLLCFGDFYQLPPINTKFVFESPLWNETIHSVVPFETIYRQKDPVFQTILNEIREGNVSDETDRLLKSRLKLDFSKEEIQPTKIFTRRDTVDKINKEGLDAIKGEEMIYKIFTKGKVSSDSIKNGLARMDDNAQYQNELVLKVGAQVMLIANVNQEEGLVNGRLGIVTEMNTISVTVRFKGGYERKIDIHEWKLEDNETIMRCQIPLILAYAITTHKCQGSTLDSAYIDIGPSIFEYGQAYVALSRVKTLDALYLHDYSRKAIRAHPKVIEYYKSLYE
jgi:ATP-dependent DNA helicase PIF1